RTGPSRAAPEPSALAPARVHAPQTQRLRHFPRESARNTTMNNLLATLPSRAAQLKQLKWVETGAALAALQTGGRIATRFVRRNPAVTAAAVAGAGLLYLAA